MDYFEEFVASMSGDNMERTSGMGMQYVNDRSQSNGSSEKLQDIIARMPNTMMMMLMVTLIFLLVLLVKLRRELNCLFIMIMIIL